MFKRLISFILISVLSLVLLAGCSQNGSEEPGTFDAVHFVDECKILVPAKRYDDSRLKDFEIDFPRAVLDKFAESSYYKKMTEDERKSAFQELTKVMSTYSYGNAVNGFMKNCSVNMVQHTVSWNIMDFDDTEIVWKMPGY